MFEFLWKHHEKSPDLPFMDIGIFAEHHLAQYAPTTRKAYYNVYLEWVRFLGFEWDKDGFEAVLAATKQDAVAFVGSVRARKGYQGRRPGLEHFICSEVVRHKATVLRGLYEALIDGEYYEQRNPFSFRITTERAQPKKRPTLPIPFEFIEPILNAPSEFSKEGIRDRAILCLLFYGACRASEVRYLRLGNVELDEAGAHVVIPLSKGRREIEKFLPSDAGDRLGALIDQRMAEGAKDSDFCFVSYDEDLNPSNKPMCHNTYIRLFKRYGNAVGLKMKYYTPHSARVTTVTWLDSMGWSASEIQAVTGHANIRSVLGYIRRNFDAAEHPGRKVSFGEKSVLT